MKPYTIIDAPQRSQAWFDARIGRLTGSVAAAAIDFQKKGPEGAKRIALRKRLVAERLTRRALDDDAFVTAELQRGIALEDTALAAYEAHSGLMVRRSGFLSHDALMVGCSLDGHVGADVKGIVEIKVPKSTTHLGYLLGGDVPEEYVPQGLHNLWVSEAEWLDFVSFDDRFRSPRDLFIVRTRREDVDLVAYELAVRLFLSEVDKAVEETAAALFPVESVVA